MRINLTQYTKQKLLPAFDFYYQSLMGQPVQQFPIHHFIYEYDSACLLEHYDESQRLDSSEMRVSILRNIQEI